MKPAGRVLLYALNKIPPPPYITAAVLKLVIYARVAERVLINDDKRVISAAVTGGGAEVLIRLGRVRTWERWESPTGFSRSWISKRVRRRVT